MKSRRNIYSLAHWARQFRFGVSVWFSVPDMARLCRHGVHVLAGGRCRSCCSLWPVKQHEKLVCFQRQLREAATVIVGEVDFEGAVQYLDDGADMSAARP